MIVANRRQPLPTAKVVFAGGIGKTSHPIYRQRKLYKNIKSIKKKLILVKEEAILENKEKQQDKVSTKRIQFTRKRLGYPGATLR